MLKSEKFLIVSLLASKWLDSLSPVRECLNLITVFFNSDSLISADVSKDMISSPFLIPNAIKAKCNAAVPEETETTNFEFVIPSFYFCKIFLG